MTRATLTITSKNYSSWSLRGWLLARFAGLDFEEILVPADDPGDARRVAAAFVVDPGAPPRS